MIAQNGKVYCDGASCHLEITRHMRSVRVLKPQGHCENPHDYMHFHNREGYSGDCFIKTLERAEALKKAKPPTQEDRRQYELFLKERTC